MFAVYDAVTAVLQAQIQSARDYLCLHNLDGSLWVGVGGRWFTSTIITHQVACLCRSEVGELVRLHLLLQSRTLSR